MQKIEALFQKRNNFISITMTKMFDFAYIELHDAAKYPIPFEIMDAEQTFGVMTLTVPKVEITQKPLFLLFTVDITGSMSEKESNSGLRKIDYVIQTFTNMISYLSKLSLSVHICVNTFHDQVDTLIEPTELSEGVVIQELIHKMKNIETFGTTNIELALKLARGKLATYVQDYPRHQIVHLFMTDGAATSGEKDPIYLKKLVDSRFHNIFVGFGLQHNGEMLRCLSDNPRSEYQFVDNMENTTLVYGETIHQFLYPALQNVEIIVENGTIYNWQSNSWCDSIQEPLFMGEANKKYHIRTAHPDGVQVVVSAISASTQESNKETVCVIPPLMTYAGELFEPDLTKYIFRQRVQELLASAKSKKAADDFANYKNELRNVFRQIRQYMRQNELLNDPFMKTLCDDLYVVYATIDRKYGLMYSVARQTSQGRQQTYNISSPLPIYPREIVPRPSILRKAQTADYHFIPFPIGGDTCNIPTLPPLIHPDEMNVLNVKGSAVEYLDNMEDFLNEKNRPTLFLNQEQLFDSAQPDTIENYKINPTEKFTCYASPTVLNTVQSMASQSDNFADL